MAAPIRDVLRSLFRRISRIYFRNIVVTGNIPEAETGGRLFAANHVNGLVDPILVLTTTSCAISPIAKSTLWSIPGLRWLLNAAEAVPIVRRKDAPEKNSEENDRIFQKISEHLGSGGNILIFPEGTSHNEPHLVPLRTGAARMLAKAHVEAQRPITFQAVGLEFDARDTFRSNVLVLFGPVRNVADFAAGETQASAITEAIKNDLSSLLIEAPSWETRIALAHVAEMFFNDNKEATLLDRHNIGQEASRLRAMIESAPGNELAAIIEAVEKYFANLDAARTTDRFVARGIGFDSGRAIRGAILLLLLPLSLLGMLLYYVPYLLPRIVGCTAQGEIDVVSTYKLGTGLLVYPLWFALLAALIHFAAPAPWNTYGIAIAALAPFAALPYLDREDALRAALTLFRAGELSRLREERKRLQALLEAARVKAG